ncbi:serine hydrolase domain-containing protein [Promicromonospora kroppenstedtii]|uniref:serine hydrolase domain-containing protein n=1 Tax=Promicromonospora kroppenstedtii TaxID=440482 RepID=UPI00055E3418|nr:serine hydrolase domain-containing protein [Promicromonospora kroppenstedtii]
MSIAHRRAVAAATLVCLVTSMGTAVAAPGRHTPVAQPPSTAALVQQAERIVAAGVPGVVVETRDESGRRTVVAGSGDLRTDRAPRPDGRFRIGSVTKSFTATVVLSLVAEGRVDLDAPVTRYLPGVLPYAEQVSVRELLQHRSGLFDYGAVLWADPELVARSRFTDHEPSELVDIATREPLQPGPGEAFGYSNTDYVLLGMLVERITGHDYADELERRVLRPAHLRDTYVSGHGPWLPRPAMRGYEAVGSPARLTDLTAYNMSVAPASGDVVSTTGDVNRFYAALLGGRLLPDQLLREMQDALPAFPGFDYGLGLGRTELCGQEVWGHVGGVPGYGTYSFTDPAGGRQVTVAVNQGLTQDAAAEDAALALVTLELCGDPSAGQP